ncbi:MAG: hypothetical protein M1338_05200, partial [Patescibacteria group bacterium]|nr:hypothetical protein [Patescibacteria group bacterium]
MKKLVLAATLIILVFLLLNFNSIEYQMAGRVILIKEHLAWNWFNAILENTEFGVYYQRTSFIPDHSVPYKDVLQEYPQLGLAYLSIPRLLSNDYLYFRLWLLILNSFCFFLTAIIFYLLLKDLKRSGLIFLLFLPSFLFFTFNRFDIFVAFLIGLSLYLLWKENIYGSVFVLSLATLTKYYPLIFLPIYLVYVHKTLNFSGKKIFNLLLIFFGPIL